MIIKNDCNITELVIHQLKAFYVEINEDAIKKAVPNALDQMSINYEGYKDKRYILNDEVIFSPYISTQWVVFLYRLSRTLFLDGDEIAADQVYYLNKILNSVDWLYSVKLPPHFYCEHPLGSILGRAIYGDGLFVNQGTTVGGNIKDGKVIYPTIGDNVILFANATIIGNTNIGRNVIISANTYLINDNVPDNCIVFGKSPQIEIKKKSEEYMIEYIMKQRGWN